MKKTYKILKIVILSLWIISFEMPFVYAAPDNAKLFDGSGVEATTSKKITDILGIVLTVVRNIGAGLAALILMVLGCKYMLASAGDRAEIKKHAITYVIGAVVLFASSAILEIVKKFSITATGG